MPKTITSAMAERHEALHLKLSALHRQVAAAALRQPRAGIDDETRIVAEALLFEMRSFTRGRGLPVAAPTHGGLAAELGQALAALEAYELIRTEWDTQQKCIVWRLTDGERRPVKRFHPEPLVVVKTPQQQRESKESVMKLARLIDSRYEDGYKDALAGREREPPRALRFKGGGSSWE